MVKFLINNFNKLIIRGVVVLRAAKVQLIFIGVKNFLKLFYLVKKTITVGIRFPKLNFNTMYFDRFLAFIP